MARARLRRDQVRTVMAGGHGAVRAGERARPVASDPRGLRGSALSAGETDRGRLVPGHRADIVVLPAAAVEEPVETGGALWNARPHLVLLDGEVAARA